MRRSALLTLLIVVGCGESADPRLCGECRALAAGRDASGRPLSADAKQAAKNERDRKIEIKHAVARLSHEPPPEFDCPGCQARYDRMLRAAATRD